MVAAGFVRARIFVFLPHVSADEWTSEVGCFCVRHAVMRYCEIVRAVGVVEWECDV